MWNYNLIYTAYETSSEKWLGLMSLAFSNIFYQIQTKTNKSIVVQVFFYSFIPFYIYFIYDKEKKKGKFKKENTVKFPWTRIDSILQLHILPFRPLFSCIPLVLLYDGIQKDREETVFKKMGSPPVMVTRVLCVLIGFSLLFLFMIIQ